MCCEACRPISVFFIIATCIEAIGNILNSKSVTIRQIKSVKSFARYLSLLCISDNIFLLLASDSFFRVMHIITLSFLGRIVLLMQVNT